jgi:hypothetical protein
MTAREAARLIFTNYEENSTEGSDAATRRAFPDSRA